jgi:citrate synthase
VVGTNDGDHGRMLTAAEAASHLGVKLGTLYAYVSRGWLKSYRRRVGRQALYRRTDIEALRGLVAPERGRRARSLPDASSWVTVAQPNRPAETPAPGVIVTESAVSSIIDGQLAYRGYPIEEVVEHATFEEVCLLLWNGERPSADAAAELRRAIASAKMPAPVATAVAAMGEDAAPLLKLSAVMPTLAAWERHRDKIDRPERAKLIISILPLPLSRKVRAQDDGEGGMAERLLRNVAGTTAADFEIDAMNRVLAACAEHELNASTFAARVVASTGADLYASVLAALCSLSGPIHGGACARIEQMFAELASGVRLEEFLDTFGREHRLPPGFGHAIYPEGDPRAVLLKQTAQTIARRKGRKLYETALKVENAVFKRERLRPNLDFYLTVCTRMLGFPPGSPAAIFAVGRCAGWIAHALEQYANNRLIRPRMRYRGVPLRHWE